MTTREKILLALMGISLVGGAGNFSFSGYSGIWGTGSSSKSLDIIQQVKDVAHDIAQSIISFSLKPEQRYVFAAARRPAQGNPFSASPPETSVRKNDTTRNSPKQAEQAESSGLRYTGYIMVKRYALAIVGNLEYAVGDSISGTGDVILSINPDKLILYAPSRKIKWELLYTGDEL